MSASRWARLLAGTAGLRHAVGSSLRRASVHRIGQAATSALRPSRLRQGFAALSPLPRPAFSGTPAASARLRPATSSTLLARLRGASAETARLLRAELAQVRRGPGGLHRLRGAGPQSARGGFFAALRSRLRLRPASSEALARLRAASAELLQLFRDEFAALAIDAVEEETGRLTEETSQMVGPAILRRLRALGKTAADAVVDHHRLKNTIEKIDYTRRKKKEEPRPPTPSRRRGAHACVDPDPSPPLPSTALRRQHGAPSKRRAGDPDPGTPIPSRSVRPR